MYNNDSDNKPKNMLEEIVQNGGFRGCVLTADIIRGLRDTETSEEKKKRRERMIAHGDVDEDYFNR